MVNDRLATVIMPDEDARAFIAALRAFMAKNVVASWLGVKSIEFRMEVPTQGEGYEVVCSTNKQMNQASRSQVRYLVTGFIGGWASKTS